MTKPIRKPNTPGRKCTEEILREEIRALRDIGLRLCEWGITLLASVETALWFVRQELRSNMIGNGLLGKTSPLPWGIYSLGTLFLLLLSGIFIMLMMSVSVRSRHYGEQLKRRIESGIRELPIHKNSRRAIIVMFLLIPIVDLSFRAVVPSLLARQAAKTFKTTSQVAPLISPTPSPQAKNVSMPAVPQKP